MPAIMQEMLEENNNMKIVLSEEVYKRLSGCINLCGLNMGKNNNEYGTILYGYRRKDGSIYFEKPSEYDDYTPMSGKFDLKSAPNMNEELIQNVIMNQRYNCFAHIHTHPYLENQVGGSRFLSQEDIDYYKSAFDFSKLVKNKDVYSFGGLLTVDNQNTQQTDDISFVHYDSKTSKLYQIPNIFVINDGKEIPLKRVNAEYVINQQTGEKVNFKRALFYGMEKNNKSISPFDISKLTKKMIQEHPGVLSKIVEKIKNAIKKVRDFCDKER